MNRYWETATYEQPTAAEIKKNAAERRKKEKKKGAALEPVTVQGRTIVRNWWGKAWCENLERYADYESRLDRGKRYVRAGAVLDLKIQKRMYASALTWRREKSRPGCREPERCPTRWKSASAPFPRRNARESSRNAAARLKIWRSC